MQNKNDIKSFLFILNIITIIPRMYTERVLTTSRGCIIMINEIGGCLTHSEMSDSLSPKEQKVAQCMFPILVRSSMS